MLLLTGTSPAVAQKTVTVEARDNVFAPADVTIEAGGTITFRNTGQAVHRAEDKGGAFDSGDLFAGDSKSVTLNKEGTFQMICRYHEALGMTGQIVVQAAGSAPAAAASPSPSPTASPSPVVPEEEAFDPDAGVPIGMKVFPFIAGGLLVLLFLAVGLGYIRNVQKTTET